MLKLMKYSNQLKVIPFMCKVTIWGAGTHRGLIRTTTSPSYKPSIYKSNYGTVLPAGY